MRDALLSGVTHNIFPCHAKKVAMRGPTRPSRDR
jgi:hypothetical protein